MEAEQYAHHVFLFRVHEMRHTHHVAHVIAYRVWRRLETARDKLRPMTSDRLQRLVELGFLDGTATYAADSVLRERRRLAAPGACPG